MHLRISFSAQTKVVTLSKQNMPEVPQRETQGSPTTILELPYIDGTISTQTLRVDGQIQSSSRLFWSVR